MYNAQGYFQPNPQGIYSVNSVTAVADADGAVTVGFAPPDDLGDEPNTIPVPAPWNFLVRLYRPRAEVLDGSWTVPQLRPA